METLISYCTKAYDNIIKNSKTLVSKPIYENNKTTFESLKEGVFENKLSEIVELFLKNCKSTNKRIINLYMENNDNEIIKQKIHNMIKQKRKYMDKPFNIKKKDLITNINELKIRIKNYSFENEKIKINKLINNKKDLELKLKELKKQHKIFSREADLLDKCTVSDAYNNNKLLVGLQDLLLSNNT